MTKLKFFLLSCFIIASFFLFITSKKSDWFSIPFIEYDKDLWPQVNAAKLSSEQMEELQVLLKQPFYFLGSGNQTFAFASNDGKYVLKFFKFQHLKENRLWSFFKSAESRLKRIHQVFSGHALAFDKDQDNSGILFAHLSPSQEIPFTVTVYDKKKSKYVIQLNDVVFVIQKRGESTNSLLKRLLDNGEVDSARAHVKNLLTMYVQEYQRGLFDRDHNIMHNSGFCDGKPMHIDVGKLRFDENIKDHYITDLRKVAWERIDKWMIRYYPQFRDDIADELSLFIYKIQLLQKA